MNIIMLQPRLDLVHYSTAKTYTRSHQVTKGG